MTAISKNVYVDKFDEIVNKYNNAYYVKIKKKPADVKNNTYVDSDEKTNDKDPKF